ncbi:MAG: Ig-like domain-containing protein, partial [Pseudomonadota bacterium]|nr:Ig-like domain-containing protein [Pseudomonadota bacterium]
MTTQAIALNNGKTAQPLKPGQANTFKAKAGEHYRVVKGKAGEEQLLDNVIAKRIGDDLQLQYADGTQVTLENYYAECKAAACDITLPGQDAGGYTLSGEAAAGATLGGGASLVYAHGGHDTLVAMAQGNAALHSTLAGIEGVEITYIPATSSGGGLLGALGGGLGLAAAAGGGGGAGSAVAAAVHNIVTVSIVAGPMLAGNGLTVNLYQADGTTLLGSGQLSDAGTFSFDVGAYTGVVIAKVLDANTGADYIDEATGQARDITADLMAVGVVSTGTVSLNINALTTIASTKAGAVFGGASTAVITADVASQSNAAVASAFGLTDLTSTVIVTTVDATGAANPDFTPDALSAGEKYGAVLAALSGMDAANSGNMQTTIDSLATELSVTGSTGTLSTSALDAVIVGARTAAATTNGTGVTNLTAVVSDLIVQTSASVAIDHIATDDVVNASEQTAAITGTTVAGATVNLSIGGNVRAATVSGTAWSYTLTGADITAMGQGGETLTATATLSGGGTASATRSIAVDSIAPANAGSLAVTGAGTGNATNDTTPTITGTAEAGGSVKIYDTDGATLLGAATADASGNWSITSSTLSPGAHTLTVTVTDLAGNTNANAGTISLSIDTSAPSLTITSNDSALSVGETATLTFTLSEAASNFAAGDISVAGGALSGFTAVSSTVYTATFTPTANSTTPATINVASGAFTDAAGNSNSAATQLDMSVDTLAPSVVITSNDSALSVGETATLTFTLSEAASNFAAGDISVAGGALSGFTAVSSTVYTATFTPTANSTTAATVNVASGSFTDAAGNSNSAATQLDMSVDTLAPGVVITDDEASTGNIAGGDITYTFTFAEAVTGFVVGDITVVNGAKGAFTPVSATVYTLVVTPTAGFEGNVTVDVAGSAAIDAAANNSSAATQSVQAVDMLAPTLSSSTPADNATAVVVGSNIVLTFSENVAAGSGNIVISNGAGDTRTIAVGDAQVTISSNVVTLNPTADLLTNSSYNVQMAAGVLLDAAGNPYAGIADAITLDFSTPSTVINLSAIAAGSGGFVINGQCLSDLSGISVASAGDVNGDGLADLIVGARYSDPTAGSNAGRSYVVFVMTTSTAINLSAIAAGSGGFVINGQGASDQSGISVASAGDVNGDGLADLIVGARYSDPTAGSNAGRSYVV